MERASAWQSKARALLEVARAAGDDPAAVASKAAADLQPLRALIRESDTIYAGLEELKDIQVLVELVIKILPDEEPEEQNWAQCDECQKWRRLGPYQVTCYEQICTRKEGKHDCHRQGLSTTCTNTTAKGRVNMAAH